MFHRTNRLLLRPIWGEDAPALHRAIADEGVVRNLARAPWPYDEADARAFAARPVDPLFPRLLVTLARDAQVIGCIGLEPAEVGAELGYWIARPHWGQGYAEPLFDGDFDVLGWRIVGERHLKLELGMGGNRLNAIHFGGWDGDAPPSRLRIAYRLVPDDYRGNGAIQLLVVHREPASSPHA